MSKKTIQLSFFIGLTLGLLVLSFFIFKPYLGVIFISSVLAVVFYPLYEKLVQRWSGRKALASLATVAIIFVCILIPLILLSASLLREAVSLYGSLAFGGVDRIIEQVNTLFTQVGGFLPGDTVQYLAIDTYARGLLDWVIGHFDSIFTVVFGSILNFILMIFSLYYLFMYGDKIKKGLVIWSPLPNEYDEEIITELKSSVDAVIKGRLLVLVAQGLFIGLGFYIFGVPNAVLWGFVGGIASLLPIIGTSIVTFPAVVYLFLEGSTGAGIGLLIWSLLCVGLVDNVLAFFFLKDKLLVHPLIVLFAILGGVEVFGAIGFIVGPVVVSAFLAFMRVYPFILSSKRNESGELT